jgi:hypothetical protein
MRSIVLALTELLGVLVAGFLGFFVMLAYVAGFLLLLACGFACAGFLLVALFSMGMWLFTHDAHAFRMMLGYFAYAGGAFAVITALSYYHGKFADAVKAKGEQRIALCRIGEFHLMRAATFEPAERAADASGRTPPPESTPLHQRSAPPAASAVRARARSALATRLDPA